MKIQAIRTSALAALALATPALAHAHAILVASTPKLNGIVHGSQVHVDLRFNSRIDGSRCTLSLLAPGGEVQAVSLGGQSSPSELNAELKGLHAGAYMLRWQALASDGHITRGEIPFHVE